MHSETAELNIGLSWHPDSKSCSAIRILLWPPCVADADIIFSSCGFFYLSIYRSSFFPSPNLTGRRLDVYHTSTHCKFRMQVWNVLRAARWKYRTKKVAKNRHLGAIAQLCRAISSQLRHVSTIGKKLVKQQFLHTSPQYGELQPTRGWDRFVSLGHPR